MEVHSLDWNVVDLSFSGAQVLEDGDGGSFGSFADPGTLDDLSNLV